MDAESGSLPEPEAASAAPAELGAIIRITTEVDFVAFEIRLSHAFSIRDRHAKGQEQALLLASLRSYLLRLERGEESVVSIERLEQAAGMIMGLKEQMQFGDV